MKKLPDQEDTTKKAEESFRTLGENIPDIVARFDLQLRHLYVSSRIESITGHSPDVFIGKTNAELGMPPPLVEKWNKAISEVFASGEIGCIEFDFQTSEGIRSYESRLILEKDENGQPLTILSLARDITEQKRAHAEKERLLLLLQQSQKMEVVGLLTSGIAHDFNNLLTIIMGNCELLLGKTLQDDPRHTALEDIFRASTQAASITSQLLSFNRKQTSTQQIVNVSAVIRQMISLLERLIGKNIEMVFNDNSDGAEIKADTSQLQQIIMNLAVNARDAMPGGGIITIGLDIPENSKKMILTFNDTGCGIREEILSHLFEPFYTTKTPGEGTGLGLSIVNGIVTKNGWDIHVETKENMGTTFHIVFPLP